VLIVEISKTITVNVGALGLLVFPSGLYAYVGSAQNNLELRVKRHQSRQKRLFWHIDYLLNNEAARVIGVYYMQSDKAKECKIAVLLDENAESIAGFGCSDCHCKSHLFRADRFDFLGKYMQPYISQF
jgi:Uri superfamily endonuclease